MELTRQGFEIEQDAEAVKAKGCEYCSVVAGEYCRTARGDVAVRCHKDRMERFYGSRPDGPTAYTFVNKTKAKVITIEWVLDIDESVETHEALDSALDQLRTVGAAEVVSRNHATENFDTACAILDRRKDKS